MLYSNAQNSRAIGIVVIELNIADAYWFGLVARQAQSSIEVSHYPTGMVALREWRKGGESDFDLLIVADLLPMLSLREFLDAAKVLQPAAKVVITGEMETAAALTLADFLFCAKPLSMRDLGKFVSGSEETRLTETTDQFS